MSDLNAAFARIPTPLQAPILEQWELERYRESGVIFDIGHDTIPFPIHAPRLACLQTRFYPLLHSGISGTIRELEIVDARVSEILVATNYLGVLVELPALERIILKTFQFQPLWWQPLATPPIISLPHLKQVTLHGYRDLILLFLSSVQPHPTCLFNLHLGITSQCGRRELDVLGERIVDKMKLWQIPHILDSKFFISVSESDANHLQIVPCSPKPSQNTPSLLLSVHKDNTHNPKHIRISYLLGMFYRIMKSIVGPAKATIAIAGDLETPLTQGGLLRDLAMPSVIDLTLHNPRPSTLADIYSILRLPSRWLPAPNLEILRFAGDSEWEKYWGKEVPPGQTKSTLDTMLGDGTAPFQCPLKLIDVSGLDQRCPLYEGLVHSSQTLHRLGVELRL
jgi:hypothetical protein